MTEKIEDIASTHGVLFEGISAIPSPLRTHSNASSAQPNTAQHYWLTRPGALTDVLRQLGHFSLHIVYEGVQTACCEDAYLLNIEAHTPLWIRDVMLWVDKQPLIYAHSLTPLDATEDGSAWSALRFQGQSPLATLLYHDSAIQRLPFEWHQVQTPLSLQHTREDDKNGVPLWARHSCFMRATQPLVVAETFLNAFWHHPKLAQLR